MEMGRIKKELLDIFQVDKGLVGNDPLEMKNYYDVLAQRAGKYLFSRGRKWENILDVSDELSGRVASAIKFGVDIKGATTLVADSAHFSKEIIDGIKKGIYKIGESKEVHGRLRPAIVDKEGKLVKFFTLKKAINPSELLLDTTLYSIQMSLHNLSESIERVESSLHYLISFARRDSIGVRFRNAKDLVQQAYLAKSNKATIEYLREADNNLMKGMNCLYDDADAEIDSLARLKKKERRLEIIDEKLRLIDEDMRLIPRFVALRIYLFGIQGRIEDMKRITNEYKNWLDRLSDKADENHTRAQIIHEYFPYEKENIDYWLIQPPKMIEAIGQYEWLIENSINEVYSITVEESRNERKMCEM